MAGTADPTAGHMELFARWRAINNAPTPDELHRDILTDFDAPIGAVSYFVRHPSSATGHFKVTHGYRVFAGIPGIVSANRGKTFGYVGDVVGGIDVETFELDPTQLNTTEETRCADTPERHLQLLNDKPDAEVIGPLAGTLQGTAMLRTRGAVYIPCCLAECALGKDLTVRQAFEILWPVIVAKGMQVTAQPLVEYLMVSCAIHKKASEPRPLQDQLGRGSIGAADVICDRRSKVLYQHLPALKPTTAQPTADPQMTAVIAQMAQLNNHHLQDRISKEERLEKAACPMSVREKFGDYITDKLLKLTRTMQDDDLPLL